MDKIVFGTILMVIVTAIYLGISLSKVFSGDVLMGGMWFGYFIANSFLVIREFYL